MGMDNIFMHDAVPTWSGFLYQGRIAVYLAVRKINELREAGNESEIKKYALQMEKCEDIAVVYMDGNNKKYHSIHQVKNEKGCKLASYKDPLIQLMLEKGFCRKNNYGTPAAYLHISKEINYESESMNEHALECLKNWKADILKFYNDLSVTYDSFVGNEVTLKRLLDLMKNNTKTIGINREEYKKKYSELKKMCNDALEDIGSDNFKNEQMIKYTLGDFINYLDRKLYVTQVSEEVEIYEYETGKSYCTGSDVFTAIVGQVKRYKGESCGFIDEQFKYIADIMINFIESKILERHKCMQEKKDASYEIMLSEFKKMLDGTVENYEKEANILALNRIYNDHLESYCNACQRKNRDVCQSEICKLQQAEYRKGSLEKNEFIKFCYNLNPECDKQIFDRECLGYLLIKDGMMESVFPIIKEVAQKNLIEREDKIHIKVKNKNKVAYVTAISSIDEFQTVENIAKAMEKNQGLVETIFEADQLITTRLKENSDVWDSSCIKVRPDDIDEVEINHNENSIFVPKRPEFIKATEVIEALKYIPKEVEIQLESRKFIEYYERFYSKEEQRFIAVDVEKLRNKKKYIETLNYNFYVAELSKKKGELEHIQKRIDKLHELIIELQGYQSALKEGIQEYKKKIISDIEPLLHIYTAKILQQKFNGKSIYIHTSEDVEDIQFVNSPQDNQDILYSMSSGQLSAVALSFLLCMNQAYGAHKACSILLIDDPVQTIDDVNMVGLVDILRYGFGDRQIFISTHEQSFEWFLRYRYSKAGKNVKIFNMKDIMLQEE